MALFASENGKKRNEITIKKGNNIDVGTDYTTCEMVIRPRQLLSLYHTPSPLRGDGKVVRKPMLQTTIYTFYRRFVRWVHLAMAQDLVTQNALAGVKVPRGEFKQREHLTKEEMERWLQASPPYAHLVKARDLFTVQAGTGLAYVDHRALYSYARGQGLHHRGYQGMAQGTWLQRHWLSLRHLS